MQQEGAIRPEHNVAATKYWFFLIQEMKTCVRECVSTEKNLIWKTFGHEKKKIITKYCEHILSFSWSQDSSFWCCIVYAVRSLSSIHFWSIESLLCCDLWLFLDERSFFVDMPIYALCRCYLLFIYLFMYPFLSHELVFIIGCIYVVKLCGKVAALFVQLVAIL